MQKLRQDNQAAILKARQRTAKTCSDSNGYDLITVPQVRRARATHLLVYTSKCVRGAVISGIWMQQVKICCTRRIQHLVLSDVQSSSWHGVGALQGATTSHDGQRMRVFTVKQLRDVGDAADK